MRTADLGTHHLRYDVSGSGPVIVLMHGLADDLSVWDGLVADLSKEFTVVRYDHRGHGGSTSPPSSIGIPELATDLLTLLDFLGVEKACLVGHSMGGRTAFQFTLSWPSRVWALVSIDAQSEAPPAGFRDIVDGMRLAVSENGMEALWRQFLVAGELPDRVHRDSAFGQRYRTGFLSNRPASILACLEGILVMPRLTPKLSAISVPTLAVVGEGDKAYLDFAYVYQRLIAECQVLVIPGVGHCPHVDASDTVTTALIEFLREVVTNMQLLR